MGNAVNQKNLGFHFFSEVSLKRFKFLVDGTLNITKGYSAESGGQG